MGEFGEWWRSFLRIPWLRTVLSIVCLLAVMYVSGLVHVWSDYRSSKYPKGFQIRDLGWELLPFIQFVQIANVWLGFAVVATWSMLLAYYVMLPHRLAHILRRVMWLLAGLFALRALCILVTTEPLPPRAGGDGGLYTPSNAGLGALLIMFGARSSGSDLIFSGHTVVFVVHGCLWWTYFFGERHYGIPDWVRFLYAVAASAFCAIGPLFMVAVRWHQTVDVVLGATLSLCAYYIYHGMVRDHRHWASLLAWLDATPRELLQAPPKSMKVIGTQIV